MYAVTKRTNELMAHTYSHLYKIPTTGLRFFTVYGPYGRPDMALFKFTKNIINNKKIEVYNYGNMYRDFTYVDDTVDRVFQIFKKGPILKVNLGVITDLMKVKLHLIYLILGIIKKQN